MPGAIEDMRQCGYEAQEVEIYKPLFWGHLSLFFKADYSRTL